MGSVEPTNASDVASHRVVSHPKRNTVEGQEPIICIKVHTKVCFLHDGASHHETPCHGATLVKREREIIGGLFDSFAARWINPEAPLPYPSGLRLM